MDAGYSSVLIEMLLTLVMLLWAMLYVANKITAVAVLFCSGVHIPSCYKTHNEYKNISIVELEDLIY